METTTATFDADAIERDIDGVFRAILDGELLLVEIFERDDLRCMIVRARTREPRVPLFDPRELRVLSLRARGLPLKRIAHDLKLSQATVSRVIVRGRQKLGLESESDLVRFAAREETARHMLAAPHGSRVARLRTSGVLVLSYPASTLRVHPALTAAEQTVVEMALRGMAPLEIARTRGTSRFTIKNQLRVAYTKVGVQGRLELALAMTKARGDA